MTNLPALVAIGCDNNLLTTLSAKGCTALQMMTIDHNKLSGDAALSLVQSLEQAPAEGGTLVYYNAAENPEKDDNVLTDQAITVAKQKGWRILNGEDEITTGMKQIAHEAAFTVEDGVVTFTSGIRQWNIATPDGATVCRGTDSKAQLPLEKGIYIVSYGDGMHTHTAKLMIR